MRHLLKSIRKRLYRLLPRSTVQVSGVAIACGRGDVPAEIRDALFADTYEDTERNILLKVLRPGMRVVEIGAGIGFVGLLAARVVGRQNVFCYEANPRLEDVIRKNHGLNGGGPDLTMKAVTIDGAPVTFFRSDNIISSSLYDRKRNDSKIMVQSVPFRDVLNERQPDVIVMDVEGAEIDLLGDRISDGVRHLIVELHPHIVGQDKIDGLLTHLAAQGFELGQRDRKTVYLHREKDEGRI